MRSKDTQKLHIAAFLNEAHNWRFLMDQEKRANSWEKFDDLASRMAKREITFGVFAHETKNDFQRLARGIARHKRLPVWWSLDDLAQSLLADAWWYFFERKGGFDPERYNSAGAFIRWKARHKTTKRLSSARGENQHTRRGPGAPEYLSKTGETGGIGGLPEVPVEENFDARLLRDSRFERLRALTETPYEAELLDALKAAGNQDAERVIAIFVERGLAKDEEDGKSVLKKMHASWTRSLGSVSTKKTKEIQCQA